MYNKQYKTGGSEAKKATVFYILLLVLMHIYVLYTGSQFRYTYLSMEGDDFWVATWDFWRLKLGMTPALTNWLADYLMQFYGKPYVGATIQAVVIGATGVLFRALLSGKGWWTFLALLPPVLLAFCYPFSLSFQLQTLFFFAMFLGISWIPRDNWRRLARLVAIPVSFMLMILPFQFVLAFPLVLRSKDEGERRPKDLWKSACGLVAVVLLYLTPHIYSQQVAFIPFENRFVDITAYWEPLTSQHLRNNENIRKMVCLASEGRWKDLLYKEGIQRDAQRGNAIALRYALLAESALGTLPENLLYYPINDERLFLFQNDQNVVAQQLNRLFYLNLGICDEAFHQAMEYGLLQRNGICFSSLRQMVDYSTEAGDWEIAERFLHVLSKSTLHKRFVEERQAKIQNPKGLTSNGESEAPQRADNFVGGYPLPIEMLRLARYYGGKGTAEQGQQPADIKKMVDYALCCYILRNDANSFRIVLGAYDYYKDGPLPHAYSEFLSPAKEQ